MKSFIALPLLAAVAALAAPQLAARDDAAAATKPVKEADRSRNDCYEKGSRVLPTAPTLNEDCTGTIEYCLRGYYSKHGEKFDDADACLRSRGLDPATAVDGMRIVSHDDYDKGFLALQRANALYNRFRLLWKLMDSTVRDDTDEEVKEFIVKLRFSNQNRVSEAREAISDAKLFYKRAFGSKHDDEVEAGIDEAKGKLNAAWTEVDAKDVNQLSAMYDWFKARSEEKYYTLW